MTAACRVVLDETERRLEAEEDIELQSSRQREGMQSSGECDQPTHSDSDIGLQQDSCLWDSNEIGVLRGAFRATSEENRRLRSQVRVLREDVGKLGADQCDQRETLGATRQLLHDAETANRRLQMLANHLKTELDRATNQLDGVRSAETERNDLKRRLERMESELTAADCRQKTNIAGVEAKWMKTLEEQRLADTETKTRLNGDVARLEGRVRELEEQLRREKEDHSRTREGLEHLRVHFSALPTSREQFSCVSKNELDNWTY